MPGFPVLHYLPEFAETHLQSVGDTISSSVVPFFYLHSFPASGSFPMSQLFASGGFSFSISPSSEYSGLISFSSDDRSSSHLFLLWKRLINKLAPSQRVNHRQGIQKKRGSAVWASNKTLVHEARFLFEDALGLNKDPHGLGLLNSEVIY